MTCHQDLVKHNCTLFLNYSHSTIMHRYWYVSILVTTSHEIMDMGYQVITWI